MKCNFAIVMLVLAPLTPVRAEAQTVHAILIGDTTDPSIGIGIDGNLKKVNSFLDALATIGGVTVSRYQVRDAAFNCKSIWDTVRSVKVTPQDAVLFYYSGHGFRRNGTQTKFPEFDCRRTSDPDQAELGSIANYLLTEARPRLVIALADTCNVGMEQTVAPAAAAPPPPADRRGGLRKLFLSYSGMLTMSGAVPGEFSWYLNGGPSLGGFFTNQLLRVVDQKISSNGLQARWEDIATDASKAIFIPTGQGAPTEQLPQYSTLNLVAGAVVP
jgi:hypothetical protein